MSENLDTITKELGTRYEVSKTAAAELAAKKSEFYRAIDAEIVETETLAQQTVGYTGDPAECVKVFYPGWRVVSSDPEDNTAVIEEDPALWKRITKPARVLKPFYTVSNKDLAALQAYLVPGKMTVKLDAPRAA